MAKHSETKQSRAVDARRGTALWGVNALRTDALTRLLDGLIDLEKKGLKPDDCDVVRTALEKLANKATELPDHSFWRRTIYSELERFAETYQLWNSTNEGAEPEKVAKRHEYLKKLRNIRQKISNRIRTNQFVLQNELDLKFVADMYGALGQLVKALPEAFKGLGQALVRFAKRAGEVGQALT